MVNLPELIDTRLLAALAWIWLVLWVGHWFQWPQFTGGKLPRIWAYAYGSSTVLVAFAIWQWENGVIVAGLALLYIVAGLATCAAYGLDSLGARLAMRRRQKNVNANTRH